METPVKIDSEKAPNFEVQMASNIKMKEKMNSGGSSTVITTPVYNV